MLLSLALNHAFIRAFRFKIFLVRAITIGIYPILLLVNYPVCINFYQLSSNQISTDAEGKFILRHNAKNYNKLTKLATHKTKCETVENTLPI